MKIRTLLGLSLVGTALYAHNRHGGELTIDSFKSSLKDLWKSLQTKAAEAKDKVGGIAKDGNGQAPASDPMPRHH